MKKKLLVAAVMAAMTLSTASVFAAAPTFSGDANIELQTNSDVNSALTNRIRLAMDNKISDNMYLHGRVVMNNDLQNTAVGADKQTQLEQAYIGMKFDNLEVKAGRQPLFLGHGLLADVNGINGLQLNTSLDSAKLMGFYGKDGVDNVSAADLKTAIGNVNFGVSYMKKADTFYGVNASTKITDGVVLNAEYVKNTSQTTQNKGYWAEVEVGNVAKKGDFGYSLGYVNVEDNANVGSYITEGNFDAGKGFRAKARYGVSDNATLTVYQDMFKNTITDATKNRTDVEFEVRF